MAEQINEYDKKRHADVARRQVESYNAMPLHKLPDRLRKIREKRLLVVSDFPASTSGSIPDDHATAESVGKTVEETLRVRGDLSGYIGKGQKTMLGKAVARGWKPTKKRN